MENAEMMAVQTEEKNEMEQLMALTLKVVQALLRAADLEKAKAYFIELLSNEEKSEFGMENLDELWNEVISNWDMNLSRPLTVDDVRQEAPELETMFGRMMTEYDEQYKHETETNET